MKELGRIWKYSLGSFSDDKTEPYDNYIACVRTILFVSYLVTNCFIVAGVIRHWNDVPLNSDTTSSKLWQFQKEQSVINTTLQKKSDTFVIHPTLNLGVR